MDMRFIRRDGGWHFNLRLYNYVRAIVDADNPDI